MAKKVGNYELGKVLGEGSYGKVRYAMNTETGKEVALKIIEKERIKADDFGQSLKKEVLLLRRVKHPNVVVLKQVLASNSKIFLALELIKGGDLLDKINKQGAMKENEARRYFQQIIAAISYCHRMNVVHRDLKLENILIDSNDTVKISDFGLSALVKNQHKDARMLYTTCGTLNYIAPQIIKNQGYDGEHVDIWSCGVILFCLVAGCRVYFDQIDLPFEDESVHRLLDKIAIAKVDYPKKISKGLRSLIDRILDPNPRSRYTLEEIRNHQWFSKQYCENLELGETREAEGKMNRSSSEVTQERFGRQLTLTDGKPKKGESRSGSPLSKSRKKLEIIEETVKITKKEGDRPKFNKQMNAFDLIAYSCGKILNNMFEVGAKGKQLKATEALQKKTQFCSKMEYETVFQEIKSAFLETGAQVMGDINECDILGKFVYKNVCFLEIQCSVFQLAPNFVLVNFSRLIGRFASFSDVYKQLYPKIEHLVYTGK